MSERSPASERSSASGSAAPSPTGAARSTGEDAPPFAQLLDVAAIQRLLDALARALGVAVLVRDDRGALVTRTSGPRERVHGEGCALANGSFEAALGGAACEECGALLGGAPVLVGDRTIGHVVWSFAPDDPPTPTRLREVRDAVDALAEGIGALARRNDQLTREIAARQRERGFLDRTLNAIADPIFAKDERHRWIVLNDAYCRFMGYGRDQLLGRSDFDFFPPEEAQVFWDKDDRVFASEEENVNEERFTDAEGVTHIISTKKRVFRREDGGKVLVGVIRDITESRTAQEELQRYRDRLEESVAERTRQLQDANKRLRFEVEERRRAEEQSREMEAQLRHQQRLESIGRLAGGIAHDFNNLLTGVTGHATLAAGQLPDGHPVRASLDEIGRAAQAASRLTRQLLAFGRKQVLEPRVVDLGRLVGELRRMLERLIGEDIDLSVRADGRPDGAVCARVDPGQIEQVLLNLVVNARDAMPDGGALDLTVDREELDDESCRARPPLTPGPYAAIRVRDSGHGMDEATLRLAFEPFFTTKPPAQGTGLGLSTAFGIIRQHGGHIEAESTPGKGTVVTVLLPTVDERPEETDRPAPRSDVPTGGETILLVEDEEMVREVTSVMLRQLGYEVLEAAHPEAALHLVREYDAPIDLLVSDLVMPGMDGGTLAGEIVALRPDCAVLFMSGYTDEIVADGEMLPPGTNFLHKPFSRETLARKVRRVLESDG